MEGETVKGSPDGGYVMSSVKTPLGAGFGMIPERSDLQQSKWGKKIKA